LCAFPGRLLKLELLKDGIVCRPERRSVRAVDAAGGKALQREVYAHIQKAMGVANSK